MSIERKIDQTRETAAMYALGGLTPDEAVCFERRIQSGCPLCEAELAEGREVAAALAAAPAPHRPPAALRQRLLASISGTPQVLSPGSEPTLVRPDDTPWRPTQTPGVEWRQLLGDKTFLLRMLPGAKYPPHQHHADEQCLVLEGSLTDSGGITACSGDYVYMPSGSVHKELHSDEGCLLLIAYT